ncbi:hypothetical protein GS966_27970 [Rhodococcus hoagii]|nr:hypothetical protein [Prescottella equi]
MVDHHRATLEARANADQFTLFDDPQGPTYQWHRPGPGNRLREPPRPRVDPAAHRAPSRTEQIHANLFSDYDGQKR